jgi:hypothetical protein
MSSYEVSEPIINPPYEKASRYWYIREGEEPQRREGRRPPIIFPPRDQKEPWTLDEKILRPSKEYPAGYELALVGLIRERLEAWQKAGCPGVTRTTLELIQWWTREGREKRLFYAQLEAALTIIFLTEARTDFLQGISVPRSEPSEDRRAEGYTGFQRFASKVATGGGKTTVMGMLAAWSILNKVNDRSNGRFSDVVLVVCPNVTIRNRLRELDPDLGEASIYRTRELVPSHLMSLLTQGKVIVTNWHVFEPQGVQMGGVSAKVTKAGVKVRVKETINIGPKTTTARGNRYLSLKDYERQVAAGMLKVLEEEREKDGSLRIDAIESGLVKIPQLAVRDTTGAEIPGYFNIWRWILPQLTPAERGGKKGSPKPEAILKYAHHPIAMLGGLWEKLREQWREHGTDPRPPVFILVCKNTRIAKVIYEWLAEGKGPLGIPPANIEGFRNQNEVASTIRVDSKVVHETDTGEAKSDESRWMRLTLDTVGKLSWPTDTLGRPIYPEDFEELAKKLGRPLHPPGRDVRCIVSVGMLTEGWDCSTVTHIIGLRPFMSQLLCEQVVGRGLRRASYALGEGGMFTEEVAEVFGVPFEVIPFKAPPQGPTAPPEKRHHVHAVPSKTKFEIRFPRVEGYTQAIRNRVAVDWSVVAAITLQPGRIPPEVEMKSLSINNQGRMSLGGPGPISDATLAEYRAKRRLQELVFDLAGALTRDYHAQASCEAPAHALFPQMVAIVQRYLKEKVVVEPPAHIKDLFLAPYYGWLVERLVEGVRPDASEGEAPEIPRYESNRGPGSTAEVDFWTSREPREVVRSHVNYIVPDTLRWEQSAAYYIDRHAAVEAFVKNAGLGFAIPYLHNGQMHDYVPDFIIRLKTDPPVHLILETKGFDPLEEVKRAAAERWVAAVNADGTYGGWKFALVKRIGEINEILTRLASEKVNNTG